MKWVQRLSYKETSVLPLFDFDCLNGEVVAHAASVLAVSGLITGMEV